jgi:hypothetical protein
MILVECSNPAVLVIQWDTIYYMWLTLEITLLLLCGLRSELCYDKLFQFTPTLVV